MIGLIKRNFIHMMVYGIRKW